jgi:hypothetical protein
MYKIIDPRSFNFQVPLTQHIKAASNGLRGHDRRELEKRASASLLHRMDEMLKHAHADETYLHAIALGATEYTGPNRNGDGWRIQTLRETHPTFVKYAKLYRDHDSKDPKKSYGYVVASAFNEDMPRVELIIALNNNKTAAARNNGLVADRELQKLAENKELALSMGCSLQADTCSYCGNLAPTPKHYCKGMDEGGQCKAGGLTSRMGQLVDVDGDLHHLHADNTNRNLKFGDISHVFRGADRTAYVIGELTKRASATGGIVKSAELAMHLGLYLPTSVIIEQARAAGIDESLVKLACQLSDIEDEIESCEQGWVPYYSQAFGKQQDLTTEITKKATDDAVRTSEALARNKLCLSPAAFFHVFGGFDLEKSANFGAAVQPFLPGSFTRLVQTERFASPFYRSSRSQYKVASFDSIVGDAFEELQKFSMSREDVENRATRACLQLEADSNVKIATRLVGLADDNLTALADEYALYKLAFLASADCTPFEVKMSVLSNYTV